MVAIAAALVTANPALANNGLNLIGFGAESVLIGGADTAAASDTTSLNTNPAGLTHIRGRALDLYSTMAVAIDIAHADQFGNDTQVSNKIIPIGGAGFARRIDSIPLVFGVGYYVQGGAGAVYHDLRTAFGTRDELSALTGIVKLTPGFAWQPIDELSVGVGLSVNYASARQKVFPGTSVLGVTPSASFFGSEFKGASALGYGLRIGVQYTLDPQWTLGAVFASGVRLPLSGTHLDVNMNAAGLGTVTYSDLHLDGLGLPRELSLGAAWQPSAAMLLSAKISRLYWADAISTLTLDARQPNVAAAPAEIRNSQRLDWHNQNVFALGLHERLSERTAVMAGINYGRRPMDDATLNPIFAPTGEKHVTLGGSYSFSREYEFAGGIEYQLPERIRYTNAQLPFGANAQSRGEYIALHAMLSRRW